jgi:hypothetical protein
MTATFSVEGLEAREALDQRRRELDAQVQPWQHDLKVGDCYVLVVDDEGDLLYTYGEIIAYEPEAEDRPDDYTARRVIYPNSRYVHGGYSRYDFEGEYGTLHVATVSGPLTRESFERARQLGWPSTREGFAAVVADDPRWRP